MEYASSSEEQDSSLYVRANSFKDARRSRKYTSKRSYQGYSRPSRNSSFKSTTSSINGTKLLGLGLGSAAVAIENYENIEPNKNVPKIVIYENYESDKENKAMGDVANNYDLVEPSYSNRMESMHGIKSNLKASEDNDARLLDDDNIIYEEETSGKHPSRNQQKYTEGMEMKQTIETNDDWYASASDMEDSDSALGKPYSNAAVNPVLECVNQVSYLSNALL